jgi:hypothetical protein
LLDVRLQLSIRCAYIPLRLVFMTSIKPPASGPVSGANDSLPLGEGAPATEGRESAATASRDSASSGSFEQTLQDARAARSSSAAHQTGETPAASELAGSRSSDPVAPLLREIEAGRLSMDQAVARLLDQTVQSLGAQLNGAQRAELSGLLRDALAHDPTLRALRDDRG